jgi:nucleoside-diphosphate-sugar epimerase
VVIGAGGGTGGAIVRLLSERGRPVRAVARRRLDVPEGSEALEADVSGVEGARAACAGAAVIFHCVQPPYTRWPEEFPALERSITAAAQEAGAKLVMADNLYAYGPAPSPLVEDPPQRASGRKGRLRVQMSEALLEAHAAGRLEVAIGRASDLYGPGARNSVAGARVFDTALAGRTVALPARLDQPRSWSYVDDVGRGLITLADRPEASGGIWHLPTAEPLTGRAFLELVFAARRLDHERAAEAGRSRAYASSGRGNPSAGWTKNTRSSAKPTPTTRPTASGFGKAISSHGTASGGGRDSCACGRLFHKPV